MDEINEVELIEGFFLIERWRDYLISFFEKWITPESNWVEAEKENNCGFIQENFV